MNRNLQDHNLKGWTRIGRYDLPERRSTWARFVYPDGPPDERGWCEDDAVAIEICSGREGDDAFVSIDYKNPIFLDMKNVIAYSIYNVEFDLETRKERGLK